MLRNPRDSCQSSGTSKSRRLCAKYSSSSRAVGVEPGRRVEHARADAVGQFLQDRVVAFVRERDADEADVGRREQQRTERAVDGPVGDVEDAGVRRFCREPRAQELQRVGGHRERAAELLHDNVVLVRVGTHVRARFSVVAAAPARRRFAMPSAAARRAASMVPPTTAATSA